MRLPVLPKLSEHEELPLWPPLLVSAGAGSVSAPHAHHAMHLIACMEGTLRVRSLAAGAREPAPFREGAGVLTGPDVRHEIDASGAEVLMVFFDPESAVGRSLRAVLPEEGLCILPRETCAPLLADVLPERLMLAEGARFTARLVEALGGRAVSPLPVVHPRVRALLRHLARAPHDTDLTLEALARVVALSPSRLMHVFTRSIGVPLRPYLAWLRTQRAAHAIVSGASLSAAAQRAGFADAAHMTRTFRATFGVSPSTLQKRARAS